MKPVFTDIYFKEYEEAFTRQSLKANNCHSFLYRYFLTKEERIEMAEAAITVADIICGNYVAEDYSLVNKSSKLTIRV